MIPRGSVYLRSDTNNPYWIVSWLHNKKRIKITRIPGTGMLMLQTNQNREYDLGYMAAMGLLEKMRSDKRFNIYNYYHSYGRGSRKHLMSGTTTYRTWECMLQRCRDKMHKSFHNYGGRGISVCKRWLRFKNFIADMGERPPGKTLDRIDNDLGYYKENCRWATPKEQANNRRLGHLRGTGTGENK